MKNRDVIKEVALRSGANDLLCSEVMQEYETYSVNNITRMSRKHIDKIVDVISYNLEIDKAECLNIMTHAFDVINEQIKTKIPFAK